MLVIDVCWCVATNLLALVESWRVVLGRAGASLAMATEEATAGDAGAARVAAAEEATADFLQAGACVEYFSKSHKQWIPAAVEHACAGDLFKIDIKTSPVHREVLPPRDTVDPETADAGVVVSAIVDIRDGTAVPAGVPEEGGASVEQYFCRPPHGIS